MSYLERGYITLEELREKGLLPPPERPRRGPVAVAECPDEIPCDICVSACPFNAITMEKIYSLPRIDWEKCTGCGLCVAACPGSAIFLADTRPGKPRVGLPYEMNPPPRRGMRVRLYGRDGRLLGEGRVAAAWEKNKTWVVIVDVPEESLVFEVRHIEPLGEEGDG